MSLSFDKLKDIASQHGFFVKSVFKHHEKCKFIEFYSSKIYENIIVKVSDDYKLKLKDGYEIKKIDTDKISDKYTTLNDFDINDFYTEIELKQLNIDKLEEELMNEYKKNIVLTTTSKNIEFIKDDVSQLRRLLNCVHNLKYKLALIHKVWLFTSDKNNNVYCYNISDFQPMKFKYLYVMIDLETFITNISTISLDIQKIQNEISDTVEKSGKKMSFKIHDLYSLLNTVDSVTIKINDKKENYKKYEENFKELLNNILLHEMKLIERLNYLPKGINNDLERANIEKELTITREHKQEVISKIVNIKEKIRDLMLIYDMVIFESIILTKKILDNVKKLNEIIK